MMNNPFKINGEMAPVASINSVYVDDTKAYDLFRPTLMMQALLAQKDQLGITDVGESDSLLSMFQALLTSDIPSVRDRAVAIAEHFGDQLARVLATLFDPSERSRANRANWDERHWAYWRSIHQVYLVGGLTSPRLTGIFLERIQSCFQERDIRDVTVSFIEGSQNLGTRGMATLIDDGDCLLFDFGQTNIKRARHVKQNGKVILDVTMDPLMSRHLFYKTDNAAELQATARMLDNFMVDVIEETAEESGFHGSEVFISIANYVSDGAIYAARGGYGKLALLAPNYRDHLSVRLSKRLGQEIRVSLFHDTSAMALLFQKEPHTAVISLGTAFGVAFVD